MHQQISPCRSTRALLFDRTQALIPSPLGKLAGSCARAEPVIEAFGQLRRIGNWFLVVVANQAVLVVPIRVQCRCRVTRAEVLGGVSSYVGCLVFHVKRHLACHQSLRGLRQQIETQRFELSPRIQHRRSLNLTFFPFGCTCERKHATFLHRHASVQAACPVYPSCPSGARASSYLA